VRQRYRDAPPDVGEQWTRTAVVKATANHRGKVMRLTGGSPSRNIEDVLARL
jgi:hypothetical protein